MYAKNLFWDPTGKHRKFSVYSSLKHAMPDKWAMSFLFFKKVLKDGKTCVKEKISVEKVVYVFTQPLCHELDMTQVQIFKWDKAGLNSVFFLLN